MLSWLNFQESWYSVCACRLLAVVAPPLLTSAMDRGGLSASCPVQFPPPPQKKSPPVPLDRRLCGPRACLYAVENRTVLPALARRYTDWAISTPEGMSSILKHLMFRVLVLFLRRQFSAGDIWLRVVVWTNEIDRRGILGTKWHCGWST